MAGNIERENSLFGTFIILPEAGEYVAASWASAIANNTGWLDFRMMPALSTVGHIGTAFTIVAGAAEVRITWDNHTAIPVPVGTWYAYAYGELYGEYTNGECAAAIGTVVLGGTNVITYSQTSFPYSTGFNHHGSAVIINGGASPAWLTCRTFNRHTYRSDPLADKNINIEAAYSTVIHLVHGGTVVW